MRGNFQCGSKKCRAFQNFQVNIAKDIMLNYFRSSETGGFLSVFASYLMSAVTTSLLRFFLRKADTFKVETCLDILWHRKNEHVVSFASSS